MATNSPLEKETLLMNVTRLKFRVALVGHAAGAGAPSREGLALGNFPLRTCRAKSLTFWFIYLRQ